MRVCLVSLVTLSVAAASCSGGGGGNGGREAVTLVIPLAGIPLTVHGADGVALEQLLTDSSGEISLDVPKGGSFAIYYSDDTVAHVIDPPSGSQWSFPVAEPTPQATPPPNATVMVTLSPVPAGADSGRVRGQCANTYGLGLLSFNVAVGCNVTSVDFVALALSTSGVPLGWGIAEDTAVTPGGSSSLTIDASNTAFDPVSFTLSGIPAAFESGVSLTVFTGADDVVIGEFSEYPAPGPASVTASGVVPQALTDRVHAQFFVQNDIAGGIGEYFGESRWGTTLAAVTTSASVPAFPLARVTFDIPDVADPLRPVFAWTRGGGSPGTVGIASFGGQNSAAQSVYHLAYFAADREPLLQLPETPATLSAWQLTSFDDLGVVFLDGADPASALEDLVAPNDAVVDATTREAGGFYLP